MVVMERHARRRSVIEVTAAVALPAVAAAWLHRLGAHPRLQIGWSDLETWLEVASADDVAVALLRLVGLAAAYWVLATTTLYVLARLTRVPAAIRAVEWATLPAVRRAADRTVALALVGSSLAGHTGTALAAETGQLPGVPPPPVVQVDDDGDGAQDEGVHLYEPTPAGDGQPEPDRPRDGPPSPPGVPPVPPRSLANDGDDPSPREQRGGADHANAEETAPEGGTGGGGSEAERSTAPAEDTDPPAPRVHEVAAGDNLWTIAERTLADAQGRQPSAAEICGYWQELIDRNHDRLRSGDPDLIYPGELLELPTTPEEDSDG